MIYKQFCNRLWDVLFILFFSLLCIYFATYDDASESLLSLLQDLFLVVVILGINLGQPHAKKVSYPLSPMLIFLKMYEAILA